MSSYIGYCLIDDIVTLHTALFHHMEAGNTSCQKDLYVSLLHHKVFSLFFPVGPETLHCIDDIPVNLLLFYDRIFRAAVLNDIRKLTSQRRFRPEIHCPVFSGRKYLIVMDHIRKDHCKISLFHMKKLLSHPKFQGSLCDIDKLYGIMKMRRSMGRGPQMNMEILLFFFVYWKNGFFSPARFDYFFCVFGT